MYKLFIIIAYLCIFSAAQVNCQIYVSNQGSDNNSGSKDFPLQTLVKSIDLAAKGDTIYVREGSYIIDNTIYINSSKSGTDSAHYYLFAYNGERPLLNFSGTESGKKGIVLKANYWYIKGFDIYGAGDNGMEISAGSFNTIEFCSFFENEDTGLQLSNGASNNRIINCDSYLNADPPDYGDADGFSPKLTCGSGNYFYGCRSWGNVDDGWDGYLRGADSIFTTLENCWTWGNGYLRNGTDPGSQANGNGFKMGGGDNSNSEKLMHHFTLKNCLAFNNKGKGFDQNNNTGSMTLINCTGYNNKAANYKITKALNAGQALTVKNCVSFTGLADLGSFAVQAANSWMNPFVVSGDDFLSFDSSGISGVRRKDGSLPEIKFLHLNPGSDLIDAGEDVGLPYNSKAPDLGAFESDFISSVENSIRESSFTLAQNYPNPFNPSTVIGYQLSVTGHIQLKVYDVLGREIAILVNEEQSPGNYKAIFDGKNLSSGIYIYRIAIYSDKLRVGGFTQSRQMILMK